MALMLVWTDCALMFAAGSCDGLCVGGPQLVLTVCVLLVPQLVLTVIRKRCESPKEGVEQFLAHVG